MAKGNATDTQVNLKINGESAAKTINELQRETKMLGRELNQLTPGTDAFVKKAQELEVASQKLGEARDAAKQAREQMRSLGDDSKKARQDLLSMSPVGQMIDGFKNSFNGVKAAVQGNIQAMGLLKTAIIATGIGALVVLLTSLFQWFTKTDSGAKKLAGAMKGIEFVANFLLKVVTDLGGALFEAFENPQQALKDLGDFIVQNLINRFKAFGVILDGIVNLDFKKVADGAAQAATGVENLTDKVAVYTAQMKEAYDRGVDYSRQLDEIDDLESQYIVTNAKLAEQIAKLILQSRDRTKTEKERLKFLDQASALEIRRLNEEIDLANRKVKAEKAAFDEIKRNNLDEGEQQRKLAEAEANLIDLRSSSLDLQEKISIRRNALIDAERKKEEEALKKNKELTDKENEQRIKREEDILNRLTQIRLDAIANEFDRKMAVLDEQFIAEVEKRRANQTLTDELMLALEEEFELKRQQIKDERKKAELERRLLEIKEANELEQTEVDILFQSNQIKQTERDNKLHELKRKALMDNLQLLVEYGKGETLEAKKITDEILKLENDRVNAQVSERKRLSDFENRIQQDRLSATAQYFGALADLYASNNALQRTGMEAMKTFMKAEVITNGILEVQKIFQSMSGLGPAGWLAAGLKAGAAGIRTGLAVSRINQQKFATGGILYDVNVGKPHSGGGIQLVDGQTGKHYGEMERGEVVAIYPRKVYDANRDVIDMTLSQGAQPGAKRKFEDGGVFTTNSADNTRDSTNLSALGEKQLMLLSDIKIALQQYPRQVRAVVVYEQLIDVIEEAQLIESQANS